MAPSVLCQAVNTCQLISCINLTELRQAYQYNEAVTEDEIHHQHQTSAVRVVKQWDESACVRAGVRTCVCTVTVDR